MSIIDTIFSDYMERKFRVKSDLSEDLEMGERVREFEESFALSAKQKEPFEQFLFEMCSDYQQSGFTDGFKLAIELMCEVIAPGSALM